MGVWDDVWNTITLQPLQQVVRVKMLEPSIPLPVAVKIVRNANTNNNSGPNLWDWFWGGVGDLEKGFFRTQSETVHDTAAGFLGFKPEVLIGVAAVGAFLLLEERRN